MVAETRTRWRLPAAPSSPPAFKFKHEIEQRRQDPDKVPYDFYASHPEHAPQSSRSRWRGSYQARRRAIREG
jgi:hypothetical protein